MDERTPASVLRSICAVQDMLKVHAALLDPALAEDFPRKAWEKTVKSATDLVTLRDALGDLQAGVQDDRLSQSFARTPLLVKGAWLPTGVPLTLSTLACRQTSKCCLLTTAWSSPRSAVRGRVLTCRSCSI